VSSGRRRGNKKRGGRSRKKNVSTKVVREFWGDGEAIPPPEGNVRIAKDTSAVVRSLGRPPMGGQDTLAEHYFVAVYDRAVTLASALAAAGDLIEPEELLADDETPLG
jgi:hypothetical protein